MVGFWYFHVDCELSLGWGSLGTDYHANARSTNIYGSCWNFPVMYDADRQEHWAGQHPSNPTILQTVHVLVDWCCVSLKHFLVCARITNHFNLHVDSLDITAHLLCMVCLQLLRHLWHDLRCGKLWNESDRQAENSRDDHVHRLLGHWDSYLVHAGLRLREGITWTVDRPNFRNCIQHWVLPLHIPVAWSARSCAQELRTAAERQVEKDRSKGLTTWRQLQQA